MAWARFSASGRRKMEATVLRKTEREKKIIIYGKSGLWFRAFLQAQRE